MLAFDKLQTPPGDGDTLIEPPARHWQRLLDSNVESLKRVKTTLAGKDQVQIGQHFCFIVHDRKGVSALAMNRRSTGYRCFLSKRFFS